MDSKQGKATRQRLMETARELFVAKGVDRVGVREIASKAGVNLSLMNYYFRSKESLLEQIFEDSVRNVGNRLRQILNADVPLDEKIRSYVNTYIDVAIADPLLVSFVLSIIHRNADEAPRLRSVSTLYNTDYFAEQLRREGDAGTIRKVDPEQLYISMISLILFPFAIKPLIQNRMGVESKEMEHFLDARRELVYDMLMAYLRAG